MPPTDSLDSSLNKLSISTKGKKPAEPAESWEDEADASDDETAIASVAFPKQPSPPPPTPSSPSAKSSLPPAPSSLDAAFGSTPFGSENTAAAPHPRRTQGPDRRPETSTTVASRLIAAGIGQKPQRRTKEQREYDQAMKLQEKKRRDKAREEEETRKREKEKAIRDAWDG